MGMGENPNDQGIGPAVAALPDPPAPPGESTKGRWRVFILPVVLLVAAAAGLAVDCPLSRWCLDDNCPEFLRAVFRMAEPFGHAVGVVVIALAIHQLDRARRWALPRVLACSLGAGLTADVVKLLIVRVRPRSFDFQGDVWTTFGGWFPLMSAGSSGQSLPSAHTATAVGLAVALTWLYPAGRRLFPVLAVLVALHRIETGMHYLSDVLCGAAVGLIVAAACLRVGWLPSWFDRLEDRRSPCSRPAREPPVDPSPRR